jgi:putative intracellular protease/amidase
VTIASPLGGTAPVDPGSLAEGSVTPAVTRFRSDSSAHGLLASTARLGDIADMSGFDAIYLVGGHGTMWDFTPNADLVRLLDDATQRDAIIAAVCHGTAGLLSTTTPGSLVRGRTLTGFSDEEEAAVGLITAGNYGQKAVPSDKFTESLHRRPPPMSPAAPSTGSPSC